MTPEERASVEAELEKLRLRKSNRGKYREVSIYHRGMTKRFLIMTAKVRK